MHPHRSSALDGAAAALTVAYVLWPCHCHGLHHPHTGPGGGAVQAAACPTPSCARAEMARPCRVRKRAKTSVAKAISLGPTGRDQAIWPTFGRDQVIWSTR